MPEKPLLVLVEGNICAGKSSLCEQLSQHLGFEVAIEPTTKNPWLELYYQDPKQYALPMQIWLLQQRYGVYCEAVKTLMQRPGPQGIILDRSIFSDAVFAEQNFRDGNFNEAAYASYKELRSQLLSQLPLPDCCIYLDVAPEECHRRVHEMRKRECEDGIPLPYMQGLDSCYQNMLAELQGQGVHTVKMDWHDFGSTTAVGDLINKLEVPAGEAHWSDDAAIREFVMDDDRVKQQMCPQAGNSRPSLDVTECLSPTTDSKAAPQTPVLEETSPESSSSPTGVQEFAYDGEDKDTKGKLSMEDLQPESPATIRMESLTIE